MMNKKVLFIANHAGFSKFNVPYFEWFRRQGWIVHNASPGLETGVVDRQINVPIERNPLAFRNLVAFCKLWKLCRENEYDMIHCHTPVGGVLGRLCGLACKKTKVIYTAHGFHFYHGGPLKNWMLYYSIEKLLSEITDAVVTINEEDYALATRRFSHPKVFYIGGVGVDLNRFRPFHSDEEKQAFRKLLGISWDDFAMIYVAQFIPRKNHGFLLQQISKLKAEIKNLKLLLVGSGPDLEKIKSLADRLHISENVLCLGYRTDVEKLYAASDLLVSASLMEGFGINLVEGMGCALPVLCADIRGHRDIVRVAPLNRLFRFDDGSFRENVLQFYQNKNLREKVGKENRRLSYSFSVDSSVEKMAEIYRLYM